MESAKWPDGFISNFFFVIFFFLFFLPSSKEIMVTEIDLRVLRGKGYRENAATNFSLW